MDKSFFNDRLFHSLKVSGGRRQFVLSGEIEDYFMVNRLLGLHDLETALKEYLKTRGFEIVVFIKSLNKPEFLTPEMEQHFQSIVRHQSVDPQAQNAGHNTRTFVPRRERGNVAAASPEGVPQRNGSDVTNNTPSTSSASTGSAAAASNASQTAVEVTNAANNSEQSFLDLLTRLFCSSIKSVVVFFHPENMWIGQPTENDLRKLETVLRWSTITNGHPESASLLVINPSRLAEFNTVANHLLDRNNFTRNIILSKPGKREIESFLSRFACRYDYWGQLDKVAAIAYAKGFTLYNFSELLREYVKNNAKEQTLNGIFSDSSQAKTLDELTAEINALVGLPLVKEEVRKMIANAQYEKEERRLGREPSPLNYHSFFLGNPGTGKTMVARLLGQIFWALEIRSSQAFVEVTYSDIISSYNEGETVENMKNKICEASGGVLFIDEFYLFAENEWGRKALETLMTEMETNRDSLTVIMAGYEERLPDLYNVNPGFKSRINRKLNFSDYSVDEMAQMFELMCANENGMVLSEEAKNKLHRYLDSFSQRGGIGNGRGVRNIFEKTKENRALRRASDTVVLPDDLPDPLTFRQEEAESVLKELESNYIGLPRVKTFFSMMFNRQRGLECQGESVTGMNHCIFLGNPGTGKTSVAREMGKLFYALGIISEKNKLIEVDPIADLTSQYQSEYTQKVRDVFDRALGGVLFIDEAYQLAKDEQGRKVLDQIVKRLTEPAYSNMVVIMAGYSDDMQELFKVNSGLKRRFPHEVIFDDFTPAELCQIFYQCMERDKKTVLQSEKDIFNSRLLAILARKATARNFGNAGVVNNFYRDIVRTNQSKRLLNCPDADKSYLTVEDVTGIHSTKVETIEEILAELNANFIGMRSLKDKLGSISKKIHIERKRAQGRSNVISSVLPGQYNMRFVGNPGTGKTTIARYMARVFCSLGIIENPKVKEYRGGDLKGSYLGQTKDKVNKIFESSEGCVLVIDEIYSLYDASSNNTNSYGQEAIDTLVGCITDLRNATTITIIAGYKNKMDTFLMANQGLMSRFGTEVEFPDYTDEECTQILIKKLESISLTFPNTKDFTTRLNNMFAHLRYNAASKFGNARTVEGVFNQIIENQAARLPFDISISDERLQSIIMEDIPQY